MLVSQIRQAISNLWAERFPEANSTDFPKGVIHEISETWEEEDDRTLKQYNRRIEIRWYAKTTINFEFRKQDIIDKMLALESESNIVYVRYLGSEVGQSAIEGTEGLMILSMQFEIEHIQGIVFEQGL